MDADLIKAIAWPIVYIIGFIVLIIYRKPLGYLLQNLRKGEIKNKKGEGFSLGVEVDRPKIEEVKSEIPQLKAELSELKDSDKSKDKTTQTEPIKDENNWVHLLYVEKNYKEARKVLLKDIEERKDDSLDNILWLKAEAARILSKYDYENGGKEFDSLIRENPDSWMLFYHYANVVAQAGDIDKAHSIIDKFPGSKSNKCILSFQKAELYYDKTEYGLANSILDELLSQSDNLYIDVKAHILSGKILQKQNKIDEAKKWFFSAYKKLPTNEFIVSEIADFFLKIDEPKPELFFRHQLINLDQDDYSYWGYIGNTYLRLNLNNHAMDAYEKANNLASGQQRWITGNIGNLYNNVGLYTKAIEFLQKSLESDPSDQYSHDRLASSLANKAKEQTQAQEILEETKLLLQSKISINESQTE